jgi:TolB-like protein
MNKASKKANGETAISAVEVRAACELILSNNLFVNAPRMCRLLRFLVEKAISSDSKSTSEYAIGIKVFDRSPATYSTMEDPIVRVQVGRLREKLKIYYATLGTASDIEILIPLGSYLPVIRQLNNAVADTGQGHALVIQPIKCITQCEDCEPFTEGLFEELMYQLFRTFGKIVAMYPFSTAIANHEGFPLRINSRHEINHLLEVAIRTNSEYIRVSIRLIDVSLGCVA